MTDIATALSALIFPIRGNLVASVNDEYGQISVIDNQGYRILTFDRLCEQSKMAIHNPALPIHNYIRAMLMSVALRSPTNVLLLGLGGGCLSRAIHARDPQCAMDIVELRPAVIEVARQHFSLPQAANIHYHAMDADIFINATAQCYDLIFSDLYAADAMSPLQGMENFLSSSARLLHPEGWLVLNYPQRPAVNSPLLLALKRQFSTLLHCAVPGGNVVMYASHAPLNLSIGALQQAVKDAGREFGCDFSPLVTKLTVFTG